MTCSLFTCCSRAYIKDRDRERERERERERDYNTEMLQGLVRTHRFRVLGCPVAHPIMRVPEFNRMVVASSSKDYVPSIHYYAPFLTTPK